MNDMWNVNRQSNVKWHIEMTIVLRCCGLPAFCIMMTTLIAGCSGSSDPSAVEQRQPLELRLSNTRKELHSQARSIQVRSECQQLWHAAMSKAINATSADAIRDTEIVVSAVVRLREHLNRSMLIVDSMGETPIARRIVIRQNDHVLATFDVSTALIDANERDSVTFVVYTYSIELEQDTAVADAMKTKAVGDRISAELQFDNGKSSNCVDVLSCR